MTVTPVIAFFAQPAPPQHAKAALSSASAVSVAITDLRERDEISHRLAMPVLAKSPLTAAVHTIPQRRRHPQCCARRRVQLP
jgi:hypothetical protein